MHSYIRVLLAGIAAMAILAAGVGVASAGRLSVSNRHIRGVWSRFTLSNTVTSEVIECQVTLEGSFHSSTTKKVAGALIGHITRPSIDACTGGNVTVDPEVLPWHLHYESFSGTLPNINSILISMTGSSYLISLGSLLCRAVTTATESAAAIAELSGEVVVSLSVDQTRQISLRTVRGFGCGLGRGQAEAQELLRS